jgi:hypothetical protein
MPQLAKGGKFIFGWSKINPDLTVILPAMAVDEYSITSENRVYLMSGSKSTGGFCVTKKSFLTCSKLNMILEDNTSLLDYTLPEGEFIRYKGRKYCWLSIAESGKLQLTEQIVNTLSLEGIKRLLSIRSSDIAFTMGAFGPLINHAENYKGIIEEF